jgi:peptidyl-prolyl cis-trans isomerase C
MQPSRPWILATTLSFALLCGPLIAIAADESVDTAPAAGDPADVVVIINGIAVPRAELERSIASLLESISAAGPLEPDQRALLEETAKENLVRSELLYQLAMRQEVADLDQRVQEQLESIRSELEDQSEWDEALASAGMTEEGLREQLRRAVLIDAFVETEVTPQIEITDDQARAFYEQYTEAFRVPESMRASHILIGVDPGASAETREAAKRKADELLARVREGADFAEVARAESSCPSAQQGGDLGEFGRGQMVAPFEEAAFALEPGDISEVVETEFGYHIIQGNGKTAAEVIPFEEVKARIVEQLTSREIQHQVMARVDAFRQTSEVTFPDANP